jgi:hypothetical protein
MADLTVARRSDGDPMGFDVTVREGDSSTDHAVTLSAADLERLGAGRTPEAFVRDCFVFLLQREPKESILPSFDVSAIGRYFPDFESRIADPG